MCQDRSAGGLIDRGLGLRFMSSSVGWFFGTLAKASSRRMQETIALLNQDSNWI